VISLLPFLYIGLLIENFKLSGKIPVDEDLLQIHVKGGMIKRAVIFTNLIGISS